MRKKLRAGFHRFEVLDGRESLVTFPDISSAISFLSRFKNDDAQLKVLRAALAANSSGHQPSEPGEIISKFAELLIGGKLRMLRSPESIGACSEGAQSLEQSRGSQGTAPAKKSWIEIYLHDHEGKPAAGEKYRIKLPDGSMQEGQLDAYGHAEHYGINPGTCELWFLDRDAIEWRPA